MSTTEWLVGIKAHNTMVKDIIPSCTSPRSASPAPSCPSSRAVRHNQKQAAIVAMHLVHSIIGITANYKSSLGTRARTSSWSCCSSRCLLARVASSSPCCTYPHQHIHMSALIHLGALAIGADSRTPRLRNRSSARMRFFKDGVFLAAGAWCFLLFACLKRSRVPIESTQTHPHTSRIKVLALHMNREARRAHGGSQGSSAPAVGAMVID